MNDFKDDALDVEIALEEARAAERRWFAETEDRIGACAKANGWSMLLRSASQGGSDYYELERLSEDDESVETVTLRISDHPSLYCREDYSIAMRSGADDHSIETIARRLAQPRVK